MKLEVVPDAEAAALRAAQVVAAAARAAVDARGAFTFAVSGGRTPWRMLARLALEPVPWESVHLFQTDERVAPDGDPERNWTHVREALLARGPFVASTAHPMPVGDGDLAGAAARYEAELRAVAGAPPVLDLVHLGLGSDGHTASLVPGDPVLDVTEVDVAPTAPYQGRRRLTLTFPRRITPADERGKDLTWAVTRRRVPLVEKTALGRLPSPAREFCLSQCCSEAGPVAVSAVPGARGRTKVEKRDTMGRREFTVASVMALLSGVAITVSGCGGGGSSPSSPSTGGTTTSSGDRVATISGNHGHAAVVTGAMITAGSAVSLNIRGSSDHPHTVSVSASEIQQIGAAQHGQLGGGGGEARGVLLCSSVSHS